MLQVEIVQSLCQIHAVPTDQIAVLTPYSAQKHLIEKMMRDVNLVIRVALIIETQGESISTGFHMNSTAIWEIIALSHALKGNFINFHEAKLFNDHYVHHIK